MAGTSQDIGMLLLPYLFSLIGSLPSILLTGASAFLWAKTRAVSGAIATIGFGTVVAARFAKTVVVSQHAHAMGSGREMQEAKMQLTSALAIPSLLSDMGGWLGPIGLFILAVQLGRRSSAS